LISYVQEQFPGQTISLKWCLPVIKDNSLVIMGKGRDVDEEILDCVDLSYTLVEKREQTFGSLIIFRKEEL